MERKSVAEMAGEGLRDGGLGGLVVALLELAIRGIDMARVWWIAVAVVVSIGLVLWGMSIECRRRT